MFGFSSREVKKPRWNGQAAQYRGRTPCAGRADSGGESEQQEHERRLRNHSMIITLNDTKRTQSTNHKFPRGNDGYIHRLYAGMCPILVDM